MEKIKSFAHLVDKISDQDKSFLLLYKSTSDQSDCAYKNLESAVSGQNSVPVFTADVSTVRDIHTNYGISSAPSLLIFENGNYVNAIKGCQDSIYYKALIDNALYFAKAKAEGKEPKRVTVYSTPTCSWCNTLKAWLRKNAIPFSEIDVSRDEKAAQDLVNRSGQQGVPQTDINGRIVVGFDQHRLKELLEIN